MIDLPDIRQEYDYDFGAACAVAVMNYYGDGITTTQCRKALNVHKENGTDFDRLVQFFRSRDRYVLSGEMDYDTLADLLKRGKPVVCLMLQHYIVATGIRAGQVRFHDPEAGKRYLSRDEFLHWWNWRCRPNSRYGIAVW